MRLTSQPPTSRKAEIAHPAVIIRACESRVAVQAYVSGWSIKEDLRVTVFNSVFRFRFVKLSLLVLSVLSAGSLAAQSLDQQVAERLKPIGEVCLAGQACASGGAAPVQVAAATGEFSAEQVYTQNCAVSRDRRGWRAQVWRCGCLVSQNHRQRFRDGGAKFYHWNQRDARQRNVHDLHR